jgi:hypothetical protein
MQTSLDGTVFRNSSGAILIEIIMRGTHNGEKKWKMIHAANNPVVVYEACTCSIHSIEELREISDPNLFSYLVFMTCE